MKNLIIVSMLVLVTNAVSANLLVCWNQGSVEICNEILTDYTCEEIEWEVDVTYCENLEVVISDPLGNGAYWWIEEEAPIIKQYYDDKVTTLLDVTELVEILEGDNLFPGVVIHDITWNSTTEEFDIEFYLMEEFIIMFLNPENKKGATNIPSLQNVPDFNIYPNPASNSLTIELPVLKGGITGRFELFSVVGEKLFSEEVEVNNMVDVDISDLPNGYYIYRYVHDNAVKTGKLTIER